MDLVPVLLGQLLGRGPVLLAYLIAIGVAVVLRPRAPSASNLVMAGCGVSLLTSLGTALASSWVMVRAIESGMPSSAMGMAHSVIGITAGLAHAVGLSLLVAAAFTDRGAR
jgi:hypothetical protein